MEFLEAVVRYKVADEEVSVHLIAAMDEFKEIQQIETLKKIKEAAHSVEIYLT